MIRLLALGALVIGSLVGATSTSATPSATNYVCAQVWTGGTVLGYHAAGTCTPVNTPTLCANPDLGFDPHAHVYTLVCIPD